jgi:hypothetical protein
VKKMKEKTIDEMYKDFVEVQVELHKLGQELHGLDRRQDYSENPTPEVRDLDDKIWDLACDLSLIAITIERRVLANQTVGVF